ncbi:hypothetical protein [Nocardia seriolae]|nr:hypothetical protein [Nocardia seriolae]APA97202.1 hypothetical protein NS506_03146 [Nocardia seriolae]MTJ62133.1 hypothetical protein [Nocardia seriolae]MTJ72327.1 hypothetical protein [Nocardia seriolae]MTJ87046.1 hypothetical protein [Nocardia seriolae]MTK31041.1 hypothetical protein [Nocardia seriolae]
MNAMLAASPAPNPIFHSVSQRIREFFAEPMLGPQPGDARLLARTPLAVLGPAPRR